MRRRPGSFNPLVPPVSSCQLVAKACTTNRNETVSIVAVMSGARPSAAASRSATTTTTRTATRTASQTGSDTVAMPNGASGSAICFATGDAASRNVV